MKIPDIHAELIAAREADVLDPGRVLDTAVLISGDGVDVCLTNTAIEEIVSQTTAARNRWEALRVSDELSDEERAIVSQYLGKITLGALVAEQVLYDSDVSDEIAAVEREQYDHYDSALYQTVLHEKIAQISTWKVDQKWQKYRDDSIESLKDLLDSEQDYVLLERLSEQAIRSVREWLYNQYGDVMDEIDSEGAAMYDADAIVRYFQMAIDTTPSLHNLGWSAETIVRQKKTISVSQTERKILVSVEREVTCEDMKKLVIHEVFGHALRGALAEENQAPGGRLGTATNARFEESFCVALEQCLAQQPNPWAGIDHYLAIGMAVDSRLSKERIVEVMYPMILMRQLDAGKGEAAARKRTSIVMESIIRRTFAGMTDVDDSIAHMKDINYVYGASNAACLLNHAVATDALDETMRWVMSAKFNPFTPADNRVAPVEMPACLQDTIAPRG